MWSEPKSLPASAPAVHPVRLLLGSTATLFLSAGLLFLVQPMVTKMVLPQLGGSPSVWNTCICFFQAVLLLGYGYAHALATRFGERYQAVIHGTVLILAALFLPLDLTARSPPPDGIPVLWLIGRLATTVGPPFFAISATAPLLQRWFSRTDHPAASDPYFLYAASNTGSLLALLTYPLLVEPYFPLSEQSRCWSAGFGLLAAGIVACWLGYRGRIVVGRPAREAAPRPAASARVRWIAYSFVPSAMLLAVTAHITTDLVSAPLFWVIPLALYLSTFILTFARHPPLSHGQMVKLLPFLIILVVVLPAGIHSIWLLLLHLASFFVIAMVCHGELARYRPPVRDLTEFYIWISFGGVLGGVFDALLAPAVFPDIWEYPLVLVAACLIRPDAVNGAKGVLRGDLALPALLFAGLSVLADYSGKAPGWFLVATLMLTAVALLKFSEHRWRFALGVAGCLLVQQTTGWSDTLSTARSFFGVYRVKLVEDGALKVMQHGTTLHGIESTRPGEGAVPLSYYNREGPFGRFFEAISDRQVTRVGVIGLGTGSLACYAQPGQVWTFHEIDPEVEKLARGFFEFLGRCGNDPRIVIGDARLTLHHVPDEDYDVIIIDAFSSDSIPIHLLTREALSLYHRKLAADGVILFHISNRHLDLAPVIAALARDANSPARHLFYIPPGPMTLGRLSTEVVAVGQPGRALDSLSAVGGWDVPGVAPAAALWTDDRSDIIGRLNWR
jgi:SAM-dependent methyltransferase